MSAVALIPLLVILADGGATWKVQSESDGITITARQRERSDLLEFKAVGMIVAPPQAVFALLTRFSHYRDLLPYTEKAQILKTSEDGRATTLYIVTNPPIVSRRDYCAIYTDDSEWKDGRGYLLLSWKPAPEALPQVEGNIRLTEFGGSWRLTPQMNGTRTLAEYHLFTNPRGTIPAWVLNKLSGSALFDMMKLVRARVAQEGLKAQAK